MENKRIGDILIDSNVVTSEQVEEAIKYGRLKFMRVGDALIHMGIINEETLIETLKVQLGIELIDFSKNPVNPSVAKIIPREIAQRNNIIVVEVLGDTVKLAMNDPLNLVAQEEVKWYTGKKVVPCLAYEEDIKRAIAQVYNIEDSYYHKTEKIDDFVISEGDRKEKPAVSIPKVTQEPERVQESKVVEVQQNVPITQEPQEKMMSPSELVNEILERAVKEHASDIHMEPQEDGINVRIRVDGLLYNIVTVAPEMQKDVINHVKEMGHMDVSKNHILQSGNANVKVDGKEVELQMHLLPTVFGEQIVMSLQDNESEALDNNEFDVLQDDKDKIERLLLAQAGVILLVGPIASGKTMTMQKMVNRLNNDFVNIISIEDVVENKISGINQVQIDEKSGITYKTALNAALYQNPDIIVVEELRDKETIEIAMKAALTGHLVIASVHTEDAYTCLQRFNHLGVRPYLTATAVNGVISQRMVRRICPDCRKAYIPTEEEAIQIGIEPSSDLRFYKGQGCPKCFNSGYRGKTPIFEIITLDEELRYGIQNGADREELRKLCQDHHIIRLADNCRRYVLEGVTTLEETRHIVRGNLDF